VDGKYLSAVGYGPFRSVAGNDTPEGRAQNRRIEIVLAPLDVGEVLKEIK
jgi:flagellar motor protein MotB